jgi:beta-lactam-binding protein with PASTA domain
MKYIVAFLLLISFSLYSIGGSETKPQMIMPDLTGLDETGVTNALTDFDIQIINRNGTSAPTQELSGKVQVQDPLRGQVLTPGQYVRVTYFRNFIPERLVPNLIGLKVEEAQKVINSNDLYLNETDEAIPRTASGAFKIFWQKPLAGQRVPVGTTINYKVFINYLPKAPKVVGDNVEVAKQKIENEGLKYSIEYGTHASYIDQQFRVYEQDPRYGIPMKLGETVKIKVYDKPIESTTPHIVPQYQTPF